MNASTASVPNGMSMLLMIDSGIAITVDSSAAIAAPIVMSEIAPPQRERNEADTKTAGGRVLTDSRARPEPPGAPPPPIWGTWEHPLGERLDTRWLHFNDDSGRPRPHD
jgi:hypothetical protein